MRSSLSSIHEGDRTAIPFTFLSWSLIVYALTLTISHSPVYFPLAGASLCAMVIWFRRELRPDAMSDLKISLAGLGAFFLWQILTRLLNGKTPLSAPFEDALMLAPLFLLYQLPVDSEKRQRCAAQTFAVLASVFSLIVLLSLIQKLTGLDYPFPRQLIRNGKLYALYSHYNQAGSILSPLAVALAGMALFWQTSTLRRMLLWSAAALMMTGTLMTFSRGYFLALALSVLLMLLLKSIRHALAGTALAALILSVALAVFPAFRERTMSIFDISSHPSNMERIYFMKIATDMISDHPVAGIGQKEWSNNVDRYAAPYRALWTFSPALYTNPHNLYLLVAVETGVPGLILFLSIWVPVAYVLLFRPSGGKGSLSYALSMGAGFIIVNHLFGGFFDDNLKRPINVMFVVLLVSLAFLIRDRKKAP
jgi:O-antigen ligase